ncbi:AMP-binding protein [Nitrospirillum sp. BR 11164]|uniref:AMP-binding protein n=1 Tax=Nitrospirillum sp. BR 11164 TaxID=3104324 RepID=UPI002AFFEA94|nr:AMP-binding protein [Nitrospirillum sp. BR 11164]MEA1648610.1 AMP-binding protein [Nitrospirillum sp. BR 11164]
MTVPPSFLPAPDPVAFQAAAQPDTLALADLTSGRRYTYAALDQAVNRCAAWLAATLGAPASQRVAVLGRNDAAMIVLHLAGARLGSIFAPLNWRLTVPELAFQVRDAEPALLLADAEFLETARRAAEGTATRVLTLAAAEADWDRAAPLRPGGPPHADTPSTLLYTSGTSGRPKGALLTESNLFFTTVNFGLMNKIGGGSVVLCDMPLFHVVGLVSLARTPLTHGGTLLVSRGFEPSTTLSRLADPALGITHYMCVPQMAQTLRQHPDYDAARLRRLVALCTGGAPMPAALIQRFCDDGITIADGYGMSEAGTVLGMPLGDRARIAAKAGSAGIPGPTVRLRLVDDDGQDVPDGQVGEVWISGPNLSAGYWRRPELPTLAQLGGWLRTGDAARRDADGYYYLVDRKKDMFISGGENVYPAEVEAAVMELDCVAEVAVIGVPDERWGETGWAYVVVRAGQTVTPEQVLAHLDGRIARYKRPQRVLIVGSLPRTGSGKVQKHVLRQQAAEE